MQGGNQVHICILGETWFYMDKIDQTAESILSDLSTLGHDTIPTFPVLILN